MDTTNKVFLGIGLILLLLTIIGGASLWINRLTWDNEVGSYIDLADKSSNLQVKYEYVLKYRTALYEHRLTEGYSNPIWQTPTEDLNENFKAVESLVSRMDDIRALDVNSAEYQWALSQVTEEEIPHIAGTCSGEGHCGNYDNIFYNGWNYQKGGLNWFWQSGWGFVILIIMTIFSIIMLIASAVYY